MSSSDIQSAVTEALDGFDPTPFAGARVTVAVPDATRPLDYEAVLTPLLDELEEAQAEVTLMVALGLHRPMSEEELEPLESLAASYGFALVQHNAYNPLLRPPHRSHRDPHPAHFDRDRIIFADALIAVGVVEPHQYAGFSGGVKTIAIGCAAAETIGYMHSLEMLRREGLAVGRVEGNPFQQTLWELVARLPPIYSLSLVPSPDAGAGALRSAHWGPAREAFDAAVEQAMEAHFVDFDEPVRALHLPVPETKAQSFYQASRAATYVALCDRPAVAEGGVILLEAACPEGIGQGRGEANCALAMARGPKRLLAELRGEARPPNASGGQQRAYVLAMALQRCDIVLIGAPRIGELEIMGIRQFDTLEQAKGALDINDLTTVTDVFHRVPRLSEDAGI